MDQNRPETTQRRSAFYICLVVTSLAAALRVGLALHDHSVFWPDEIYQSLEQAHRAVFGYGFIPWEFRDGARSWLFPGALAGLWRVASFVGVESSLALIVTARMVMVASSVVVIWYSAKLADRLAGPRAGIVVAVLLASLPPLVVFSYRAMSETASAPFVVLAAWYSLQSSRRSAILAGILTAIACLLRYQNGLLVVFFAASLLLERRWRDMLSFVGAGTAVALLGGILDWATWGRPFHSFLTYVDFNLIVGGASTFGVEPFWFYAETLWSSVGPLLPVLLACFFVGAFTKPILGGAVVAYILVHSVLPHKELRFLLPCLPLFVAVASIGVEGALKRVRAGTPIAIGLALATTAAFSLGLINLTYEKMGQYKGMERGTASVWRTGEEPSLLLADAGRQPDVCGVAVLRGRAAFTGGYTYLHRDVPLIFASELCRSSQANYVIGPARDLASALPYGYSPMAERGAWTLYRRDGGCHELDPDPYRLLEGAGDMGLGRQAARQASDGSLHFDLQRDSGAFTQGWGAGEQIDCDAARWVSGHHAFVDFDFQPEGAYRLNLRARAHEAASPQRFAIAVNGTRLHVGPLSAVLESHSFPIPDQVLRSGANRMDLAFSRTSREVDDPRALAALFRLIEIVPEQDDFTIDVALSEASPHLVRGFQGREQDQDATFVWSDGPISEIEGTLTRTDSNYVLEVIAEAIPLVASQRTRVFANDHLVGTIDVPTRWASRRITIPASLIVRGKNRIRLEYEATVSPAAVNPKLADRRQLAVRFRRFSLTPLPARSALDIGTAPARPLLLEGWSGDENEGARSFAWTNGKRAVAVLALRNIKQPVLKLSARGYEPALPIKVTVSINTQQVGAFLASDDWQEIALTLPAIEYSAAGDVVALEFDRTAKPSDRNPTSNDHRDLSLKVDRIWVEPEPGPPTVNASISSERASVASNRGRDHSPQVPSL